MSQHDFEQSTAGVERLAEVITKGVLCPQIAPLTITVPVMNHWIQHDVSHNIQRTCEWLDSVQAAYGYDMVSDILCCCPFILMFPQLTEEPPPSEPPSPTPTLVNQTTYDDNVCVYSAGYQCHF